MKYLYLNNLGRNAGLALAAIACGLLASCADFSGMKPLSKLQDAGALDAGVELRAAPVAVWPDEQWWKDYGDPQLDGLVDAAIADNPNLRLARARVGQAQGFAATARAATLPQVEGDARFTRTYLTRDEFSPSLVGAHTYWEDSILLRASYDLDLWGKDEKALESALDSVKAGEAETQAARLSLTTAIVQAYVQLSAQFSLRDVVQANLEREQKVLDIAERRHRAGLGTELEINEAATVLPDTQAQIERIDENIALAHHQLAALAGKGPGAGDAITRPVLALDRPVAVPEALPAGLLGHRPDIVAQRWRVEAAGKNIEVAKARFYPDINLVAFAGVASLSFSQLLTGSTTTGGFGPAISLPIFEGGRLRGNLRVQDASYDAAVETYNSTVISALHEVADQVTSLRSIALQLERTTAALASAKLAEQQALQGFHAGLTDYLSVLNTQASLLVQQRNQAQLIARQLETHAALMKALGGGYHDTAAASSQASTHNTP